MFLGGRRSTIYTEGHTRVFKLSLHRKRICTQRTCEILGNTMSKFFQLGSRYKYKRRNEIGLKALEIGLVE